MGVPLDNYTTPKRKPMMLDDSANMTQENFLTSLSPEQGVNDIQDAQLLCSLNSLIEFDGARRWRFVPGYESFYVISNDGHIVSLPRPKMNRMRLMVRRMDTKSSGVVRGPFASLSRSETKVDSTRQELHYDELILRAFVGPKPWPRSTPIYSSSIDGTPRLHLNNLQWSTLPSATEDEALEDIKESKLLSLFDLAVAPNNDRRWRYVKDMAKAYAVSSDGHILRLPRPGSRDSILLLKPSITVKDGKMQGSPRATLIDPATSKSFQRSYSTVMLEAFHGPKPSDEHRARILCEGVTNLHIDNIDWHLKRTKPVNTLDTNNHDFHVHPLGSDDGPLEDIEGIQLLALIDSSIATHAGRRWRFVRGLAQAYVVSNDGHIVRMPHPGSREKAHLLKPSFIRRNDKIEGSPRANFTHPVTSKYFARSYSVVMLEAFHGPKPSDEHRARILHEDKTNLHIDHIDWYVAPSKPKKTPRPQAKEKPISDVRNKEMLQDLNKLCPHNENRRWRPIKNYEQVYFISDDGHIVRITNREKDAPRQNGGRKILLCARLKITTDGVFYGYSAKLTKGGVSRYATYAALMLETFIGPKPSKDSVAHNMNGNAEEILLSNLEWSTRKKIRMQFIHGDANAVSLKSENWSEWNLYIRLLYCALNEKMLQLSPIESNEFVERSPDACNLEVYQRIAKAAENSKAVRIESLECSSLWGVESVRNCFNIEARHIGLDITEKGVFRISR